MKYFQEWTGVRIHNGLCEPSFPARVPGNIQYDYAVSHGFSDVYYADGCRQFEELERDTWEYRSLLHFSQSEGERIYFVSHGIDYRYDILLNNDLLYSYEGVFAPAELDLTDRLTGKDELCVRIYPHPKREGAQVCCTLPDVSASEMTLLLESSLGTSSYRLLYRPAKRVENKPRLLNQ